MSEKQIQLKAGLFVLTGLVLLAGMIVLFSKGFSFNIQTYRLELTTPNVGGLKKGAAVLLAGVPIGRVTDIRLTPDSKQVAVALQISRSVVIHGDARFVIEQSGFLGDQYICVIPGANTAPPLKDGDTVRCEPPFNLLETARNAAGFLARMDDIARKLDAIIAELREHLLNRETLTNISDTIAAARETAQNARAMLHRMDLLLSTNTGGINSTISNLTAAADALNRAADMLADLGETNAPTVANTITELENSAKLVRQILEQIDSGQGLLSTLIRDTNLPVHLTATASNLAVTTSNVNRFGLWRVLWKPRTTRTNTPTQQPKIRHYNADRVNYP